MEIIDGRITGTTDGHFPQYFIVATEAEKPTNPGAGDKCSVAATGKEYTCFVANVWSLTNSPSYNEYSNHFGTVDNIMSIDLLTGGTATTDSDLHRMDLSAANAGDKPIYSANLISVYPALSSIYFNAIVQNINIGAGGSRSTLVGLLTSAVILDGVFFKCSSDGQWTIYISHGSPIYSQNISSVSNGDTLTIFTDKQNIIFLKNGTVMGSYVADFLDSHNYHPLIAVSAGVGVTSARTISVDYIGWRIFK